MKVGTIVVVYNLSVEIFLLQMGAIKKFCKDEDNTVEIFDNSDEPTLSEHIRYHAENLGLNYYKIASTSKNSSDSHSWAANFAYQKLKDEYSYLFFADHDLIPVKDYSIVEILSGGHVMAGLGQGAQKTYMWQGCVMISLLAVDKDLIDFRTNHIYGLDTGGNLYKIVDKYGKENCIFFNEAYHQNPFFNGNKNTSYAMINDEMFLHCIGASNWFKEARHEERINTLINIIKEKTGL